MSDAAARRARRQRWLTVVGGFAFRLLALTWRMRAVNLEATRGLLARKEGFIYCLWHGELLPLVWQYRGQGAVILISEHGDGELIARLALALGHGTVRGSSSRGGDRALLLLTKELKAGKPVALTPDGPRGPRHSFAPGTLIVAHRAGAPIIPVRAFSSRVWRLKSWDAFEIPKPFARVTVVMGDPVYVQAASAREAAAQTEAYAAILEGVRPPADD